MQEASFALQEAPLFQSLTSGEIAFLWERVHRRAFKPEALLLEGGRDSPGLYVIAAGLVAVVVQDEAGLEREIARLGKGECVGEISLMTGEPCSATVRAITDTEAWFIERGDFVNLIDHCPGLWRNLGHILSQRLVRTSRYVNARKSNNAVALIMACPEEETAALAVALAASVARQTGKKTLLVDARSDSARPVADSVRGKPAPSLSQVLDDPSLLKLHEAEPDVANGLCGARIAALCDEESRRRTEEESLTALEWLRPLYDHVLILLPPPPGVPSPALLNRVRSVMAIVAEEEAAGILPWLDRLCGSPDARRKVEAAFVAANPLAAWLRQAAVERFGGPVRRIPKDGRLLQQMLREKTPFTEAHPESPCSQAVARLARHIGEMEVGLALGAGGPKGFAHIGVLRVLDENAVPIDYVAGCSIGAIVGAGYALGWSLAGIEKVLQGADRRLVRWTLPFRSIWSDAGLKELLREPIPTARFSDLDIAFAAVATDLATGREAILRKGLIWRALQASASVPGIFPCTVIGGRYLVDGGLVSPVPTQTVRDMGADIVVAVDLMSPSARAQEHSGLPQGSGSSPATRIPNLVEILWRATEIMQEEVTIRSAATADVTIQPKVGRSRWSDFSNRGQSFIAAGEEAAREALPELRRLLPFLAPSPASGGSGQ